MRAPIDPEHRAIAARIAADHPGWLVLWGPFSRRYYAFAVGRPDGVIIDDPDPDQLARRIRQATLSRSGGNTGTA